METLNVGRESSDPEADAEDAPLVDGVYVVGAPLVDADCPDCGFPTGWEIQDTHEIGGKRFSERAQSCGNACGWTGVVAWFPWFVTNEETAA